MIHAKGIYDSDKRCMKDTGLLIRKGEIAERGAYEELKARYWKEGMEVLEFPDEYVMPGLINVHVHLELTPSLDTYSVYVNENEEQHISKALMHANEMLRSGVTAARDLGSSMKLVAEIQHQRKLQTVLPGLQLSGVPLTETRGHMGFLGKPADSEQELVEAVKNRKKAGCGCIKIIATGGQMTPGTLPEKNAYDLERIKTVVKTAHSLGLPVSAHCLTASSSANAFFAGVDTIEHWACFRRNQEMNLLERIWEPERVAGIQGDGRFFMIGISNNYHKLDEAREGRKSATLQEAFLLKQEERECEIFRELLKLGMCPLVGTDAGCGLTYFDETWLELALLVERCGLSETEAIHAATVSGAEALGMETYLGKLKAGYRADLITLKENPLQKIRAFQQVTHVMLDGTVIY